MPEHGGEKGLVMMQLCKRRILYSVIVYLDECEDQWIISRFPLLFYLCLHIASGLDRTPTYGYHLVSRCDTWELAERLQMIDRPIAAKSCPKCSPWIDRKVDLSCVLLPSIPPRPVLSRPFPPTTFCGQGAHLVLEGESSLQRLVFGIRGKGSFVAFLRAVSDVR